jgi:hypothetical protein
MHPPCASSAVTARIRLHLPVAVRDVHAVAEPLVAAGVEPRAPATPPPGDAGSGTRTQLRTGTCRAFGRAGCVGIAAAESTIPPPPPGPSPASSRSPGSVKLSPGLADKGLFMRNTAAQRRRRSEALPFQHEPSIDERAVRVGPKARQQLRSKLLDPHPVLLHLVHLEFPPLQELDANADEMPGWIGSVLTDR